MGTGEQAPAPDFRGSISRRLTVLSALFFLLVLVVGGLSVLKARTIARSNAESRELYAHITLVDRIQSAVFHLRGEVHDAMLGVTHSPATDFGKLASDIRADWHRFEQMHFRPGAPWITGGPEEKALYDRLERDLESFLGASGRALAVDLRGARQPYFTFLHDLSHRVEAGVRGMRDLHHRLIQDRVRLAEREMAFIFWTYVAFIALGGLAVAAGSVLFLRRMAVPLRRLNAAAADIAQGGFERRVPVISRDEIGMLAHTFNRMAEALSERDAQVRRRAQEAQALHRIGTEISSLLHIDRIITSVVESARALFGAEGAGLALGDGAAREIRWTVFAGGGGEGTFKQIRLRPGQGVAGRVVATGGPVAVEDAAPEIGRDPEAYPILAAEGLRAALAVPLRRGDRTRGALMVAYRAPRRFGGDEVVLLSSFANQVAVAMENAELYEQVRTLHRVGMEISSQLKLGRVLHTVVENARGMLRTEVAAICLLQDGGPRVNVVAMAGPWEAVMGPRPATCCDDPAAGCDDTCARCHEVHRERGVGHLSAPLKRGDQVLGALCVGSAKPRPFSDAERDLLGGLAAQAAVAIENARLYEAVRGLGAAEERERLAREMHDGLAQALGFLNLKLGLAERSLDGAAEPVRRALAEMRKVAGDAYDEVRQAIFGLRTMVSRGLGLVPTLTEYLHEFSQQTGLDVKLDVPEDEGLLRFPPEVEVQLIRIIQEALHNVWKHASARAARVRFRREGEDVLVSIEDDGVGFDPGAPSSDGRRHFGLATMRERAEAVGGALDVRAAPGAGTRVLVRLSPAAARGGTG